MSDLRAADRDFKRASEKRHKWGNGVAWGPGRLPTAHPRPAKGPKYPEHPDLCMPTGNPKTALNRSLRQDYAEVVYSDGSASSGEDNNVFDWEWPHTVYEGPNPAGDVGVPLSFDAARGPSSGSKILGYALEVAVERFENKATDKLVKDEYEVLDEAGETVMPAHAIKKGRGRKTAKVTVGEDTDADADVDEEYEFV